MSTWLLDCWLCNGEFLPFCEKYFGKGVLLHKFLVFWEKKGKQNHQLFFKKRFSKKFHNCLKQHERLNCLMDDYNLSNITKWKKKKKHYVELAHVFTTHVTHTKYIQYMLQGIYIFISMHKHTRLKKLFQILWTTIATNFSRFNISISNTYVTMACDIKHM